MLTPWAKPSIEIAPEKIAPEVTIEKSPIQDAEKIAAPNVTIDKIPDEATPLEKTPIEIPPVETPIEDTEKTPEITMEMPKEITMVKTPVKEITIEKTPVKEKRIDSIDEIEILETPGNELLKKIEVAKQAIDAIGSEGKLKKNHSNFLDHVVMDIAENSESNRLYPVQFLDDPMNSTVFTMLQYELDEIHRKGKPG